MNDPDIHITFDGASEGQKIAALTYMGQELLFRVFIRKPVIRKFIITKNPIKNKYLAGEPLSLLGLEPSAEYETGEIQPWTDIPEVHCHVNQGDAVYLLSISNITIPIFIRPCLKIGGMPD